jgi:phenylalanyl-tRNA synthetase beta chain
MPLVSVFHDSLCKALGEDVTEESFDELCFEFGLELDEVTSDYEIVKKEQGEEAAKGKSTRVIFKVDCPANRYDILCLEGLVRALQIFKGLQTPPVYVLSPPKPVANMTLTVSAATAKIRPFVVAAVLRGVTFDPDRYQSFIDLQDKLHHNICRRRTLVAIGTHDLSTLTPPFTYEALPPKDIVFKPLNTDEAMDGNRLMEFYSSHQQLKAYLPIIRNSPVYPVIYDSKRVVLSLPPIINGDHSKITLDTKDVFIECTATDLTKANITLNTVCSMFAEYCAKPFHIEPVEVIYSKDYPGNTFVKPGDKIIYPKLDERPMPANMARMKQALSLDLSTKDVRSLLEKMCLRNEVDAKDPNILQVQVPITRSDVMHECDLVEDLAIAYGYNKLETVVPGAGAGACEDPVNHLTDLLRQEMANTGLNEVYNWGLLSSKENFTLLRREGKEDQRNFVVENPHVYNPFAPPVHVSNPKTKEFEIVRTSLLPCVLKVVANSKAMPPPIRMFEISDVVIQEPTREVGCKNVRRVCMVHAGQKAEFEKTHGILDQVLYALNCEPEHEHKEGSKRMSYTLKPSDDPTFLEGRQASIVVNGVSLGVIGDLHPQVMGSQGYDIGYAGSAFEMNIEPFLEWL